MKVLLIAPKDPKVPSKLKLLVGGENTYTQMLLKYPPKNVKYTYFTDVLKSKKIFYHWLYYICLYLQKFRFLPLGPRIYILNLKDNYDLIYAHSHPFKIVGKKIPVVMSSSSSDIIFIKYYLHLPKWIEFIQQYIKKYLFRFIGIYDSEINPQNAKIFVFSKWAKKIKRSLKIKSQVIYPGLPLKIHKRNNNKSKLINILFAGVWFERKGGRILLAAFRNLIKKYPHINLTILGELPKDIKVEKSEAIKHYNFVSYANLKRFYKSHNILVHVPPEIEGYGMVVPEAMSFGMDIIVSKICVLPEFIQNKISGLIIKPNSQSHLEDALEKLIINDKLRVKLGRKATERYQQLFALKVFQSKLKNLFDQAIQNFF